MESVKRDVLSAGVEVIADILFPPTCVSCGRDGFWLCEPCLLSINLKHEPVDFTTYQPTHLQATSFPFVSLTVLGSYGDPKLRNLITTYKYRSAWCLDEAWAPLLKRFREEWRDKWPWAGLSELTVVPIPGDPKHVRERGIDHADRLARLVKEALVPWSQVERVLERKSADYKNADLPTDLSRSANVRGRFYATRPSSGPVLLVDDVLTTGATAKEAAAVLQQSGAGDIHLLTMAVG